MKIDTTKVPADVLRGIAQNIGWEPKDDTEPIPPEYLRDISKMTPQTALNRFADWHLGSGAWGEKIVNAIDALRNAVVKTDKIGRPLLFFADLSDDTFARKTRIQDWRNYVPFEIQKVWAQLTERERRIAAIVAQSVADREEWD